MAYIGSETVRSSLVETAGPAPKPSLLQKIIIGMRQGLAASDALSRREDVAGYCVAKHCETEEFRERFFG